LYRCAIGVHSTAVHAVAALGWVAYLNGYRGIVRQIMG
jgi:hypothetical protein